MAATMHALRSTRTASSTCRQCTSRVLHARHAPVQQRRSTRVHFFNFGNQKQASAGPVDPRAEYDADDVEHYFNYMGCLAVEGTYDRMEAMLQTGLDPVDIILLLAATENDAPKVEELLSAGARADVVDNLGRTPLQLATKPEVVRMLQDAAAKVNA